MAPATKRRFTTLDFQKMGDCGILEEDDRVELIEGEIVEMSPVGSRHAAQVARLDAALHRLASDRAIVWVQNPVELDDHSEPQPDLALLRPRRDYYAARHPSAQDVLLLVEVADSSAEHDRQVKLRLYARAGIPEVWIIDLAAPGVVEVYQGPSPDGYRRTARRSGGARLPLPGVPGASVGVEELVG